MSDGVRCMWMRRGTSKGGYFIAGELPANRDEFFVERNGLPGRTSDRRHGWG